MRGNSTYCATPYLECREARSIFQNRRVPLYVNFIKDSPHARHKKDLLLIPDKPMAPQTDRTAHTRLPHSPFGCSDFEFPHSST